MKQYIEYFQTCAQYSAGGGRCSTGRTGGSRFSATVPFTILGLAGRMLLSVLLRSLPYCLPGNITLVGGNTMSSVTGLGRESVGISSKGKDCCSKSKYFLCNGEIA